MHTTKLMVVSLTGSVINLDIVWKEMEWTVCIEQRTNWVGEHSPADGTHVLNGGYSIFQVIYKTPDNFRLLLTW